MGFGKFGLNHSDLPTMISNLFVFLRLNSISIDRNYTRIPWICHIINTITCATYFYVYVFSVIWFLSFRCVHTGDYISASVEFSLAVCSGPSVIKLLYMKLYSDTITKLVEDYLQCDSLVVRETRYAMNILMSLRTVKKRAMVILAVVVVNGILYVLQSFILPGRHLPEDLFVIYGLEPMFESPNYEVAKTMMIMGIYFGVTVLSNITVFLIVLIGYIEAQLLALGEELEHLWDDSRKFYDKYKANESKPIGNECFKDKIKNLFIQNRLKDIARFHMMCITLRDRVDKEMRFIFVVEFVFLIFAIVAELIGGLENTYMQIPFTFAQLYIDCLTGQRLIDASNVFENSIYRCKWENFDVANQKTVLIMFRCSQKTLTITAAGISVLSFVCLMQVIKTTYSAYTALESSIK